MKIAGGVEMLEISANIRGNPTTIYPTLLFDDEMAILVDTGYPGQLTLIREEIEKAGVSFAKLKKIIITHQDIDHIGSLASLLKELPEKTEILASGAEKPYLQGEATPIKLAKLESQLAALPEEMKTLYKNMKAVYDNLDITVDKTIADGEELPYYGGIKVILTPGHTPGHVCLYLKQGKILIAGDALNVVEGRLLGPNWQYTFDMDLAVMSLKKLVRYDIEKVICYHGGLFTDNPNRRIAELIKDAQG